MKVEKGNVLYLSPAQSEWVPCSSKEKISAKTYILTKDSTVATIFKDAESYEIPSDSYFFGNDIFELNRLEIVSALTFIEAEQLPETEKKDSTKTIGLIYGNQSQSNETEMTIPFEKERKNAIAWFVNNNYYSAALLSLKRIVSRYPNAYLDINYMEQLFYLYDWFGLHGFLREEADMLLKLESKNEYKNRVHKWHEIAMEKLSAN